MNFEIEMMAQYRSTTVSQRQQHLRILRTELSRRSAVAAGCSTKGLWIQLHESLLVEVSCRVFKKCQHGPTREGSFMPTSTREQEFQSNYISTIVELCKCSKQLMIFVKLKGLLVRKCFVIFPIGRWLL